MALHLLGSELLVHPDIEQAASAGEDSPTLFEKCCGFFKVPRIRPAEEGRKEGRKEVTVATFSKSRFRDDGDGNDRESLGNRSRRPRQYSSTLAVICVTATATTEALRKSYFRSSVTLFLAKDLSF